MRVSIITLTNDSSRYVDEAIGRVERGGLCELEHVVVHDGAEGFIEQWRQATLATLCELSAEPLWMFRALALVSARRRRHQGYDWRVLAQLRRDQRAAEAQGTP